MRLYAVGLLVITALRILMAPLLAVAQPAGHVRRCGALRAGVTSTESKRQVEAFRHWLREFGWVEGQNLAIAYRAAEGQVEPLSELVTDLLRLQVEVLVTAGGISATYAAKAATSTLPIVMVTSGDPVQAGLVESLARPGGNVTGVAGLGVEIIERQLTLLKSVILQEKKDLAQRSRALRGNTRARPVRPLRGRARNISRQSWPSS